MAKFPTAITAIALFSLFTLSLAGTPPENDESTTQVSLPLSEANPALRVPGKPAKTETDSNSAVVETSAVVTSVPLTEVTFRPVNRRFRVRSKHPCRQHFRIYPTLRENEEIPYGNDMIVSSGENSDFEDPVGEGRRVPGRWVRLHHHRHGHDEDSDSDDDDDKDEDRVKKIVFKRYDYDRFDREKKLKKLRKHFRIHQNEEEERKKKSSFMKRVRKFLDHLF